MKANVSRGGGFRGVLNYVLDEGKAATGDKRPELVGGTMTATDAQGLSQEFAVVRQLRPDIEKPVWHCSLSAPPGERLTAAQWDAVATDFMSMMGYESEAALWVAARHQDTDHDHIHIVASRVGLDSSVWHGQFEARRAIEATQRLEVWHGLTLTAGLGDAKAERKRLTNKEINMAIRTGDEPPRQKLQRLVAAAAGGLPSVVEFAERLEVAGVSVVASVASTGRLSGFSFAVDGVAFKGSKLGDGFSWSGLQRRGVTYEQSRDGAGLERFRGAVAGSRSGQVAPVVAGELVGDDSGADRDAEIRVIEPGDGNGGGDGRGSELEASAGVGVDRGDGGAEQVAAGGSESGGTVGVEVGGGDRTVGGGNSDVEREDQGAERDDQQPVGDAGGDGGQGREAGGVGGEGRVSVAEERREGAGVGVGGVGGGSAGAGLGDEAIVVQELAMPVLAADHQAKIAAWRRQAGALDAEGYRITLKGRVDGLRDRNFGNEGHKAKGLPERFWTAAEVEEQIGRLRRENARGYDIYVTPIDPRFHYVVVDDMTDATAVEFEQSGYSPCVVQQSSQGNKQAILKAGKADRPDEQSVANSVVMGINQKYGDPKFSGVIHPFRMAGFANKKPGKGNAFTVILAAVERVCARLGVLLEQQRRKADVEREAQRRQGRLDAAKPKAVTPRQINMKDGDGALRAFEHHYAEVVESVRRAGLVLDASRVDFAVAKSMLRSGWGIEQVESGIMTGSPALADRHANVTDYAQRTVRNALAEVSKPESSGQGAQKQEKGNEMG